MGEGRILNLLSPCLFRGSAIVSGVFDQFVLSKFTLVKGVLFFWKSHLANDICKGQDATLKVDVSHKSPHFAEVEIPVEFLVLHYTACDLQQTLDIFKRNEKKVCAHFVLDRDGTVYDLGGFLRGPILRGAHAGISQLEIRGIKYENFNQFSIGIEMINSNGNFIQYTDGQYDSLAELVKSLQKRFPILKDSERILGHEHIAYWRGKADPGEILDWPGLSSELESRIALRMSKELGDRI